MFDLEQLVGACQNKGARSLIAESIRSFNAGAYRGAIVLCWNALVVDFEEKLIQLELVDDNDAKELLSIYHQNRKNGNFQECNRFEENSLSEAEKLEIITKQELEILQRIRADRNKCAHPGFLPESDEAVILPELAKSHITNALKLFLNRSPFYSKRATSLVDSQVQMELFGTKVEQWEQWLTSTGLRNIRDKSISSFAGHILSRSLHEELHIALKYKNLLSAYLRLNNQNWLEKSKESLKKLVNKCHAEDNFQTRIFWLIKEIPQLQSAICNLQSAIQIPNWEWLRSFALKSLDDIELWKLAYSFDELKSKLYEINNIPIDLLKVIDVIEKDDLTLTKLLIDQYTSQDGYIPAYNKGKLLLTHVQTFVCNTFLVDELVRKAKSSPRNSIFGSTKYGFEIFKGLLTEKQLRQTMSDSFTKNEIDPKEIFDESENAA